MCMCVDNGDKLAFHARLLRHVLRIMPFSWHNTTLRKPTANSFHLLCDKNLLYVCEVKQKVTSGTDGLLRRCFSCFCILFCCIGNGTVYAMACRGRRKRGRVTNKLEVLEARGHAESK